jgi:PAS domain S-box-containing protein
VKISQFIWERLRGPFVSGSGHVEYPETFHEELNDQCGRIIIFAALIFTFAWLPYIPIDRQIYPGEPLIVALRVGLSLVGFAVLILQGFRRFNRHSLTFLIILSAYIEAATGVITGLTKADPAYMGGYLFVLTLMALVPIPRRAAWSILAASLLLFFIVGLASGMRFDTLQLRYSLNDLLVTVLIVALFVYLLDRLRFSSWEKSRKIGQQNETLRESEEFSTQLITAIPDIVIRTNIKGDILYINEKGLEASGYTKENIVGKNMLSFVAPEDREAALQNTILMMEQPLGPKEYHLILNKGEKSVYEVNGSVLKKEDGVPYSMVYIVRDITERKRAEEALRESEEKLRLIVETIPHVVSIMDMNLHCTYMSPSIQHLLGYTPEEALALAMDQLITPESLEIAIKAYQEDLGQENAPEFSSHHVRVLELDAYHKDGSVVPFENTITFLRDDKGVPIGIVILSTDISERKRAEEALRESEDRLRTIIQGTQALLLSVDANGRIIYANDATAEELGYKTAKEIIGRLYLDFVYSDDRRRVLKSIINQAEARQTSSIHEFRVVDTEGRAKWFSFLSTLVIKNEQFVGMTGVAQNITERKRAGEALRESEARYRTFFEQAAVGVAEIEHFTGRFLTANRLLCTLLGRTEEEMRDTTFQAITHPDDLHLHEEKSEQLLAGKIGHYTLEKRYIAKDGAVIWVNIAVSNPEGTGKTDGRNIVVVENITERKRTEAALQASEEKFRQIVNSIPNAVSMLDMNLRFTYMSAGVQRILGYTPEEAMALSLDQILTPESMAIVGKSFQERLEANTRGSDPNYVIILELEQYHKNGFTVFLENTMTFLRNANGVPVGVLCVSADITERKRVENALRRSEEQYRLIAENSDDVIFTLDPELRFTYMSPSSFKLRGVTDEEAMQEKLEDIMTPESLNRIITEYSRVLAEIEKGNKPTVRIEIEQYRKDRSTLWVEISIKTILDGEGHLSGFLGVSRDISERKKQEDALHESESKYRFLIENSNDIVWTYDLKKMAYSFCSNSIEPILGYSCEEAVGMKLNDIFSPETKKTVSSAFAKIIVDPVTTDCVLVEAEHIAKDGHKVWMEINAVLQKDNDGKPAFLSGVSRDITERKRAEVALRAGEEKFRQIVENASDFIYRLSSTGAFTFINPAAELLLGYSIDDIQNHYFWEIIPDSHKKDVISFYSDMLQRQVRDSYYEFPIILKSGAIMWVGQSIKREENAEGGVEFLGIARDISERKHAEDKLKEAKDTADAANRSKSIFLANMSHEIRTPMNAILGFAQLMQRDPKLSQQSREHIDIINRSGEHLLALINDILEMSKIEAGRATFVSSTFDLHSLINDLEMMFRVRTDAKKLRFLSEKVGDVPRWIITDEGKLRQVLINILGNAVKFTDEGGIALRLCAETGKGDGDMVDLQFEVEDTGPGMSEEEIGRLFQAFEQTKTGIKSGGTGLGLALSQGFVEIMGGSISVASTIGKGTTFRFEIPVREGKEEETMPKEVSRRVLRLRPGQSEVRVLIADDKETNRQLLSQLLAAVGFPTREVVNGAEAIRVVREWKPQVVLMDMTMPVMDGYEATRKIKASSDIKNTTIIAVTASAFEEDRKRIFTAGADGYLSKPFKDAELFENIGRLTGVDYLYEEVGRGKMASETADDTAIVRKSIATLSPDLVGQLRTAIESANLDRLNDLIGQLVNEHPTLANRMQEMAARYEYEALIELLSPGA